MSDNVKVGFGDSAQDTAVLLLAAAEELDQPASVVQVENETNRFVVPKEVAKKAGLSEEDDPDYGQPTDAGDNPDEVAKTAESEPQTSPDDTTQPTDAGDNPEEVQKGSTQQESGSPAPEKKTPAKRTTAKKTAAKKTTAAKKA